MSERRLRLTAYVVPEELEGVPVAAPVTIEPTGCCAIGIMHAGNSSTDEDIARVLGILKDEVGFNWYKGKNPGIGGGWTTILCVAVMPWEKILSEKLIKAGFSTLLDFSRRTGYPEGHNLLHVFLVKKAE